MDFCYLKKTKLYQTNLYFSPKFSGIMPMLYENSTIQLDYIEYAIGITPKTT
jgi:hypothetical protein